MPASAALDGPVFFIALAAALSTPAQAAELRRVVIDLDQYPDARCNDGTAGVFYVWQDDEAASSDWLVFLEGGAACTDDASCTARLADHPERMGTGCMGPGDCDAAYGVYSQSGSDHMPLTKDKVGLFAAAGSYFSDWNKVYVEYCSSDSWTGMGGESGPLTGLQSEYGHGNAEFSGHLILDAVLDILSTRPAEEPSITDPGSRVLFGGGSAGSIGAQQNLDYVADTLGEEVEVRGLFDAAFNGQVAYDAADPTACSSQLEVGSVPSTTPQGRIDAYEYRDSFVDESCAAAAASEGLHPAVCMSPAYRTGGAHIETPHFMIQALKDYLPVGRVSSQDAIADVLQQMHGPGYSITMDDRRQCFIDQVYSFGREAAAANDALEGWYVPCTSWHVISGNSKATTAAINGQSARNALRNWYTGSGDVTLVDHSCTP